MILVDTSVWVDHLRRADAGLIDLLERSAVVMHPFVAFAAWKHVLRCVSLTTAPPTASAVMSVIGTSPRCPGQK